VPAASTAAACLLATIALGGCASSALDDPNISSSTPAHGSLTDHEFNVAVAIARAEADKDAATITSATATIGEGTETVTNVGPACTSGTLLHIKLIGTFPTIVVDLADGEPASAVVITADPESGKPCLLSVQVGLTTPDPGATLLFAK
jgi:ABC-type Fe3+-hydroxamate transport system substrate-binding protein